MKNFSFFKHISYEKELHLLKNKPATYWEERGRDMVLKLLRFSYEKVPAYRDFLDKNNVDIKKVNSYEDFLSFVPTIDKPGYLKKYNFTDLFPDKSFLHAQTYSATSGSSGEPFYFPRGEEQDWQYQYIAEMILEENFQIKNKKTLAIIGFGLGIWIGGIFTYKVFDRISSKGSNFSIIPIGPNKEGMLKMVKKFGEYYDQIIICGYPPFIKDMIDESKEAGVDWRKHNIKLFTAAEGVPEEFRKFLIDNLGIKNSLTDVTNIYGTVELGTMAYETPFSNLVKDLVNHDPRVAKEVLGSSEKVLTLGQYYPHHIHFETTNGEITVTGYGSAMPLIKYKFPDRGAVVPFADMISRLKTAGVDVLKLAKEKDISHLIQKIPFVAVYGRGDMSVSFVGIIIYPEYVRSAFYTRKVSKYITGKFTMEVVFDKKMNQQLIINTELKKGIKKTKEIEKIVRESVLDALLNSSTEYNYLYGGASKDYKKRILPRVKLFDFGYDKYFGPGTKQKWIKK